MKRKLAWLALGIVLSFVAVALLAQVAGQVSMSPLQRWAAEGRITFNANGGLSIHGGSFTKEMQDILFPKPASKNYTVFANVISVYPTLAVRGTVKPVETGGARAPDPLQSVSSVGFLLARWWDGLWNPAPDWTSVGQQIGHGFGWLLFGWWSVDAAATCGSGGGTCFRLNVNGAWNAANSWSATSGGASCGAACVPATTDAVVIDGNSGTGITIALAAATTIASLKYTGTCSDLVDTTAANNYALTLGSTSTAANTLVLDIACGQLLANASTVTLYGEMGSSVGPTCGNVTASTSTFLFKSANSQGAIGFCASALKNVTFDSSATGSTAIAYTLGLYGCVSNCNDAMTGALVIQNTGGGTGGVTLDVSASNIAIGNTSFAPSSFTTDSHGSLIGRAATIYVAGSWNTSVGTSRTCGTQPSPGFDCGTSTVVISGNGTVQSDGSQSHAAFYNLTIGDGVTMTIVNAVQAYNALVMGGASGGTCSGSGLRLVLLGNSFTVGSGTTSTNCTFEWEPTAGPVTLPGITYGAVTLVGSVVVNFGGDVTTTVTDGGNNWGFLAAAPVGTQNHALTVNGSHDLEASGGSLAAGTSTVTVTGSVIVAGATDYVTSSAGGSWTVSGAWTDNTTSGSWSFAAPITFNASSAKTIKTSSVTQEFGGSVTFNSGSNTVTFTLSTNALNWAGTLTVAGGSSTTTLATANLTLGGGAISVGNAGALTANTSTVSASSVTMTGGTSGTITLTSGAWTVTGSWDTSGTGATFTYGTSTVNFTGTGSITVNGSGAREFYNLQIAASGKTTTVSSTVLFANVVTLGTGTVAGAGALYELGTNSAPFVNGPAAAISAQLVFDRQGNMTFPAVTTTNSITFECGGVGCGASYTVTMQGAISAASLLAAGYGGGPNGVTIDTTTSNFGIALTGNISLGQGTNWAAILAHGSTISAGGNVSINIAASYIDLGASTWTVGGSWTNHSTSASWSAGTSGMTFNSASSQTMTFAAAGLSGAELNNVSFGPNTASSPVFTFGGALSVSGTFTVTNAGAGTATVDLSTSNYALSVTGNFTIGANGSLNMRGSTITVGANWTANASGSTDTQGTSTVVFTATTSINTLNANRFHNLQVAAAGTITTIASAGACEYDGTLTVGTGKLSGGNLYNLYNGPTNTPFVNSGPLDPTSTTTLEFDRGSGFTLPGLVCNCFLDFNSGVGSSNTYLLSGNITVTGLFNGNYVGANTDILDTAGFSVTNNGTLSLGSSNTISVILARNSTITMTGNVTVGGTGSYIDFGTSTWTLGGTWSNSSTSSSWNAGTATVTFTSTGGSMTWQPTTQSYNVFYNLVLDAKTTGGATFTSQSQLNVANQITLQNTLGTGNTVLDMNTTSSYNITTVTLLFNETMNAGHSQLFARDDTITISSWSATQSGFIPRCFEGVLLNCSSPQTVVFVGTGSIVGKNSTSAGDFWNVSLASGSVITVSTFIAINTLSAAGKLVNSNGCCGVTNQVLQISNWGGPSTTPGVTFLAGADLSQSGFVFFQFQGATGSSFVLPGGLYQALYYISPAGSTVNLSGDLTTAASSTCSNVTSYNCEFLLSTVYNSTSAFNTNNHNITLGGTLFIGDLNFDAVTFNAGSSTITVLGFSIIEGSVVNLQTSTVIAYPTLVVPFDIQAFLISQDGGTVNAGSSTIIVHGAFVLWPSGGYTEAFNAQSANITVYADAGTPRCYNYNADAPDNFPVWCLNRGDVAVVIPKAYIDFGTSTWTIHGGWSNGGTSGSTSSSWNASSGSVSFVGSGSIIPNTSLTFTQPEFASVTLSGTYTLTSASLNAKSIAISGPLSFPGGGLAGSGGYSISLASSSGYVQLSSWNLWAPAGPNIDFPIHLTVSSATLTIVTTNILQSLGVYVNGVFQSRATVNGANQTMTVPGPWSTQDISITSPPGPGGGGGGGGGGNPPTLTITATVGPDGYTYTFTLNVPAGYVLTSATWNFGDGATATGANPTHTFAAAGYAYTVTVNFTLTSGYGSSITKTIVPPGPASALPAYLPLLVVLAAAFFLLLVFLAEDEGRRLLYTLLSLAFFYIAIAYVAVTDFPSAIPRAVFLYLPLAAAGASGFMAATKENRRKVTWVLLAVAAVVVWFVTVAM